MTNILNVVVEAVVRHWEYLVTEGDGEYGRENISSNEANQPERQTVRECDDGNGGQREDTRGKRCRQSYSTHTTGW